MSSSDALLRRNYDCERICASLFVGTSPLVVTAIVVFLDLRRLSSSCALRTFSLSMCVGGQESITNSRFAGIFEVGVDIDPRLR